MKAAYDIIIVGTGVAGLFAALHLPSEYKVLMLTKDTLQASNSYLAQGGISTLKGEEDYESYFEDTLKAGHYENNEEAVEIMIRESTWTIQKLIEYGIAFDTCEGELLYTREGAHGTNRILHHKDITGQEITSKLLAQVQKCQHIELVEFATMRDILTDNNQCVGLIVEHEGEVKPVYSQKVILATGGIGGLFESSTNYKHLTGDSLAIAIKHQVALQDIHYIQIHPTTLYSKKEGRRFLISEAVRGEGAILLNKNKKRFVDELLPRDVVSVAIYDQMVKDKMPYVWLSLKHLGQEKIKRRFPNIYERCLEEGYDLVYEPIPVTPAQHYFMGGVKVDMYGQTSMPNLYAVGETSCNGVHGKNRLASNSLLESLIFARRAAENIIKVGDMNEVSIESFVPIAYEWEYASEDLEATYKQLILDEIKRKDEKFYDQWCHNNHQCG
ncbi:MAG: L-aspartate oxidase [Niameybacter sp.]|uniref:L-aspartate oxidase n=1 Tax=Niameybacter sp. TaxID=2033640 RepID=UPI002FCABD78